MSEMPYEITLYRVDTGASLGRLMTLCAPSCNDYDKADYIRKNIVPVKDVRAALDDAMMIDDLSCWAHDHIKTILALLTAHTDSPAISSDGDVPLRTQSGVPDEPVDVQERG